MGAAEQELAKLPRGVYENYDSLHRLGEGYTMDQLLDLADSMYVTAHDPDGTMGWLRVALSRDYNRLTQPEKVQYGIALSNLGYLWLSHKNNPEQAYNLFMQALQIEDEVDKDNIIKGSCEGNLGQLYMYYHDLAKAMAWYKKSFATHFRLIDHTKINYSWVDLAHFAWLNNSLADIKAESEQYAKKGKGKGFLGQYGPLLNQAMRSYLAKDYGQAAQLLDSANGTIKLQSDEARYHLINRLIFASTAVRAGMPKVASAALDTAYALTRRPELSDLVDQYFNVKANYHRTLGQSAAAHDCEFRALKFRDSLFNAQKYGAIRDIETAWDAAQFDAKLRAADEEREREALNRARATQTAIIVGVAAVIIVLLMGLSWRRERVFNAAKMDLYRKTVESMGAATPESQEDVEAMPDTPLPAAEDAELLADIYRALQRHMETETAVYNPDFSIATLSDKTGFSRQQISRAVNAVGGKNFSTFVGEYRVREACRRLMEPEGNKLLIQVLAEEVGYRSRSHFSKIFRDTTGLSVTDFAKQAQRQRLRETEG